MDNRLINEIRENVINKIFSNLNILDKSFLLEYLIKLIDHVTLKTGINLENQFRQNNYRDVVALLLILLPYINDDNGEKKKYIYSLNDIYTKKTVNVDISQKEPSYVYSNIQYNRCNRKPIEEIEFDNGHIIQNYNLLIETINIVIHRLHPNWIDIFPYNINTYKNSSLYANTLNLYNNRINTNTNTNILDINDIYNTLSNKLYYDIKSIRWFIYDIKCITGNKNALLPIMIVLNNIIDLTNCVNDIEWDKTDIDYKKNFSNAMRDLTYTHNKDYISHGHIFKNPHIILSALLRYFNNYYSKIDDAKRNGYKYIDTETDKSNINKIIRSFRSIKTFYIYDYITECIKKYKTTWFGTKLLNKDRIKTIQEYDTNYISIKLMYNYAKLICNHKYDNKFVYEKYWCSLDFSKRQKVINNLYDKTNKNNWFNIDGYIKRILKVPVNNIKNDLYTYVRNNIIDAIFESLIVSGTLTYFRPNPELSDETKNKPFNNKFSENLKKFNYKGTYHWLLQTQQENVKITYKDNNSVKAGTYIDYMIDNDIKNWCTMYAMNWISQIAFFHKYLNNRVMFVTGGTGVGKTTQIPKLLLYALNVINYKTAGRVICTIPRISSMINNGVRVSEELGVNIKMLDPNFIEKESNNYQIQYEYSDKAKSHMSNNIDFFLRFVTDRTFYNMLEKNKFLKTKTEDIYDEKNIYDIVIVDEAHEHNINMDMILTLMKYTTYYNNSIKFVIMSATMDSDEPTYRRYYRNINDNLMYPIDTKLEKFKLDRINIDRRLHLSIPGQGTIHNIKEYYEPDKTIEEIVLKILLTLQDGDIIIFQPGEKDILETIKKLNNITPEYVLAIPYYRNMNERKKELIDNFNTTRLSIKTPKHISFNDDDGKEKVNNSYKVFIIVATNIAETSLSIKSLKYAIDTGTQKINRYDPKKNASYIETIIISETSRLQRKGRVGRVSDGTAYYLYNKNDTLNGKKIFPISESDIREDILQLLKTDNNLLINPSFYKDDRLQNLSKFYFINGTRWNYYGLDNMYDYNNLEMPIKVYETGYSYNDLLDETGKLYIIHPDEHDLNRNILGNVSEPHKSERLQILFKSSSILSFVGRVNNDIFKTAYCDNIFKLKNNIDEIGTNEIVTYLYSRKLKCDNEIIKIIAMCNSCNYSMSNIKNYKISAFQVYSRFNFYGGDFYVLLDIANDICNRYKININIDIITQEIINYKNLYLSNQPLPDVIKNIFQKLDDKKLLNHNKDLSKTEYIEIIKEDFILTLYDTNANYESKYVDKDIIIKFLKYMLQLYNNIFKYNDDFEWFDKHIHIPINVLTNNHNIITSILYGNIFNIVVNNGKKSYIHTDLCVSSEINDKYNSTDTLLINYYRTAIFLKKNIELNTLSIIGNIPEYILYGIILCDGKIYEIH